MKAPLTLALLAISACLTAQAQDAIRGSLAGEQAAAARRKARTDTYYNLNLDPVRLRFNASLASEYNDNVNLNNSNAQEDFILRPQTGVRAFWQVSEKNALDVTLNFGYEYYLHGARPSRFLITGDENSGVYFDLFVGDFAINLHDTFSLSQDTSQDPSISGVGGIFRLENTIGTTVVWDLNKVLLEFSYDHYNYIPFDDVFERLRHQSELGSIRTSVLLNPALTLGFETGGGLTRYDEPTLSDHRHVSVGPFAKWKMTDAINVRAGAGSVVYWFDASTFITNSTSLTGLYADVSIDHQPTKRTHQTLSFGQRVTTDINASPIELFYVRYAVALSIIRNWTFRPYFTFEAGEESRGLIQESLTRYGGGLAVSRRITQKLSGTLSYDVLIKDSDVNTFDYSQNRLVLSLLYQF